MHGEVILSSSCGFALSWPASTCFPVSSQTPLFWCHTDEQNHSIQSKSHQCCMNYSLSGLHVSTSPNGGSCQYHIVSQLFLDVHRWRWRWQWWPRWTRWGSTRRMPGKVHGQVRLSVIWLNDFKLWQHIGKLAHFPLHVWQNGVLLANHEHNLYVLGWSLIDSGELQIYKGIAPRKKGTSLSLGLFQCPCSANNNIDIICFQPKNIALTFLIIGMAKCNSGASETLEDFQSNSVATSTLASWTWLLVMASASPGKEGTMTRR